MRVWLGGACRIYIVDASSDKMVGENIQKYLVNVTGEGVDTF